MENGIPETNNSNTGKKKGRPARTDKADPWAVRVNKKTRRIIAKAASDEEKTLEDFFGTTLREYCQELIKIPKNQRTNLIENTDSEKFVTITLFEDFKTEILKAIEQTQSPGLLQLFRQFLFGPSKR